MSWAIGPPLSLKTPNRASLVVFWQKAIIYRSTTADVAQLVESQIVILVVAGSSPVVRPTSSNLNDLGI